MDLKTIRKDTASDYTSYIEKSITQNKLLIPRGGRDRENHVLQYIYETVSS